MHPRLTAVRQDFSNARVFSCAFPSEMPCPHSKSQVRLKCSLNFSKLKFILKNCVWAAQDDYQVSEALGRALSKKLRCKVRLPQAPPLVKTGYKHFSCQFYVLHFSMWVGGGGGDGVWCCGGHWRGRGGGITLPEPELFGLK